MPKNYGINIFDYKGPQSLTHTVLVVTWLMHNIFYQAGQLVDHITLV